MKNPFLSDRNIFSKVVNPLKKKSETENKDNPSTQPINNTKKEPFISNTPLARQQYAKQSTYDSRKEPNRFQPQQKMTFGKPQQAQNRLSLNRNGSTNSQIQRIAVLPNDNFRQSDYGYESFKTSEIPSNKYAKRDYKSIQLQQNGEQYKSPAQDAKFQEYRKANNFKDYSPINPQPQKKFNDSEFLNIDALGDDLNRFLAQSKNQEELCQLLGITKKPQNQRKQETKTQKRQPQIQKKDIQDYYSVPNQGQQRQAEHLPSAFAKQKPRNRQSELVEPMKTTVRVPEPKIQEREYIPTFNYMGLQHENETISREQETMPRFNPIPLKQRRQPRQSQRQNIQVFDYSRTNNNTGEKDVQQLIAQQMSALCMNGKYRTFLTSSEKIVTVKYKLQPL